MFVEKITIFLVFLQTLQALPNLVVDTEKRSEVAMAERVQPRKKVWVELPVMRKYREDRSFRRPRRPAGHTDQAGGETWRKRNSFLSVKLVQTIPSQLILL